MHGSERLEQVLGDDADGIEAEADFVDALEQVADALALDGVVDG